MDDVYYSTGQAARELGITQAKVRTLCEADAIEATSTAGGQWRISRKTVETLKRDGLPAVPRPLPEPDRARAARSRRTDVALLAEPSEEVIDSAEEVVCLENEVRSIGLRRQKEEGLDWFRERDNREAARRAEQEEAERVRQAQAETARQRQLWEEQWIDYALRSIPNGAPQPYQLDVHGAVEETLQRVNAYQSESIIRQLVDAAVDRALAPWKKLKQIAEVIKETCAAYSIPWEMKHDATWKARMCEAAAGAITRLRNGASRTEMETAARQAIVTLVREFEHGQACSEIVDGVWRELQGADSEEREEGQEAVRRALADQPIGASRRELERARAVALEPTRAAIATRQDGEMRAGLLQYIEFTFIGWPEKLQQEALAAIREALSKQPAGTPRPQLEGIRDQVIERFRRLHEQRKRKTSLIDSGLRLIRPYLDKLTADWKFDKNTFTLARELEEPVREVLEEELDGRETEDHVAGIVRRSVRQELDIH